MHCPELKDLPPAPPDKAGWPWTEESVRIASPMPDGCLWPKISIVTPSFNQGQFIEESIRSILLQGYPDLEYIIIDGGSTDGSIEIIKKYQNWLAFWVSEADRGQSHALNKGFAKASGSIYAYLNSDDLYEKNVSKKIGSIFRKESNSDFWAGECFFFGGSNQGYIHKPWWPEALTYLLNPLSSTFQQAACFWSAEIFKKLHGFDESLNFCFDRDFFIRIGLHGITPTLISERIARFREHPNSKSISKRTQFYKESISIVQKHAKALGLSENEKQKRIKQVIKDWGYINVFIKWRQRGRAKAVFELFYLLLRYPDLIFQRRILGLLRRLTYVSYDKVEEFNKY